MKELKASMNTMISYVSKEEKIVNRKSYGKDYYEQNKEKIMNE